MHAKHTQRNIPESLLDPPLATRLRPGNPIPKSCTPQTLLPKSSGVYKPEPGNPTCTIGSMKTSCTNTYFLCNIINFPAGFYFPGPLNDPVLTGRKTSVNAYRNTPSKWCHLPLSSDSGEITLKICNVMPQDSGIYTCVATNELGTASTSATIKVQGTGLHCD